LREWWQDGARVEGRACLRACVGEWNPGKKVNDLKLFSFFLPLSIGFRLIDVK
jgi:hypothetical protein